jgi:hypothetical protein
LPLQEDDEPVEQLDPGSSPLPPPAVRGEDDADVLSIVETSRSLACFQEVLRNYYEPMEVWFLRTSTDKALRLDTPDTSSRPHLSSAPDDVFYLLKLVLYRLVHSGSLPTLERMVAKVEEIVEDGFLGGIKRKMDGVYAGVRSAGLADAKSGSGGTLAGKGTEADRLEREMRGTFLVRLPHESFPLCLDPANRRARTAPDLRQRPRRVGRASRAAYRGADGERRAWAGLPCRGGQPGQAKDQGPRRADRKI